MARCKGCIHDKVCNRDVGHGYSICPHYTNTADVAPKSEVDWNSIPVDVSEALKQRAVEKAKTEVAREIFEEIEKAISNLEYRANTPRKTVRVEELKAQVDWVLHEVAPKTIAELKKKYTGEQT